MSFLLGAILLLQDQPGEEAFKEIERRIEKAKTLTVKSTYRVQRLKEARSESGILFVKEGNRAWYGEGTTVNPESSFISDGKRVQQSRPRFYDEGILAPEQRARPGKASPKKLEENLKVLTSRAGIAFRPFPEIASELTGPGGFSESLRTSNFKTGESQGRTKSISYELAVSKHDRQFHVTLWYEPEPLKLLKREVTYTDDDGVKVVTTETYTEFAIDADIPDEQFRLPDE